MQRNRIKSGLLCALLFLFLLQSSSTNEASHRRSHSKGIEAESEKLEGWEGRRRLVENPGASLTTQSAQGTFENEENGVRAAGEEKGEPGEQLSQTGVTADTDGDDKGENGEKKAGGNGEKGVTGNDNPDKNSGGDGNDKGKPDGDGKPDGNSKPDEDGKAGAGGNGEGGNPNDKPDEEGANKKSGDGGQNQGGNKEEGKADETEADPCKDATTCTGCQENATGIKEDNKTCWWIKEACQKVDKDEEKPVESMCLEATPAPSPAPQKKPAEPTPTDKKTEPSPTEKGSDPTPAPTPSTPSQYGDDEPSGPNYSAYLGILLLVAVSVCLLKYGRRFIQAIPREARYGSRTEYQGVSTNEEDNDEEWGWGDDSSNNVGDLEMPSKDNGGGGMSVLKQPKTPPFQKTRLHYRSRSDEESPSEPIPALQRSGSGAGGGSQTLSMPPQHIQKLASTKSSPKKTQPKPKDDDIFAEMGLSSMPTFAKPAAPISAPSAPSGSRWQSTVSATPGQIRLATTKSLGATALPTADDEDLGGSADWDDDADLDDLLND